MSKLLLATVWRALLVKWSGTSEVQLTSAHAACKHGERSVPNSIRALQNFTKAYAQSAIANGKLEGNAAAW